MHLITFYALLACFLHTNKTKYNILLNCHIFITNFLNPSLCVKIDQIYKAYYMHLFDR